MNREKRMKFAERVCKVKDFKLWVNKEWKTEIDFLRFKKSIEMSIADCS